MNKKAIIKKAEDFVRHKLSADTSGHDWQHINRVRNHALYIGCKERADLFIVELGALLHDVGDWKFNKSEDAGSRMVRSLLQKDLDGDVLEELCYIVDNVSFKGGHNKNKMKTLAGKVVQDADRLDGLGAIGIGRTFAFGGSRNRVMHDPKIKPFSSTNFKEYKYTKNTTINHFYEKLLKLKGRMNTKTAKVLATKRDKFVRQYLKEFLREWAGKN